MEKREELIGKGRVVDGQIAEFLGWTDLTIKRPKCPPPAKAIARWILVGTPPHPPFDQREVPHFHSDIEAAKELAEHYGLQAVQRSQGWFVRPKAAYAKNPALDAYSDEGHYSGPEAVCAAVVARHRRIKL